MRSRSPKLHVLFLLCLWGGLVLFQAFAGLWAPDTLLCFRPWECAITERGHAPFKPHFQWQGYEYGDLANMVGAPQLRAPRRTSFTTDAYGFRNASQAEDAPIDVVIQGDSFAIGTGVSDQETLPGVLSERLGRRVYNYGGGSLVDYLRDARFVERPPKVLLLVISERNIKPKELPRGKLRRSRHLARWESLEAWERANAPASIRGWLASVYDRSEKAVERPCEAAYKGFLWHFGWLTLPATVPYVDPNDGMLFYHEGIENHRPDRYKKMRRRAKRAMQHLRDLKGILADRGTRLVVLVIPDKETVYADRLPELESTHPTATLDAMMKMFRGSGIDHVPVHAKLAEYRAGHPEELLYLLDDTHPNALGFSLIGETVANSLGPIER